MSAIGNWWRDHHTKVAAAGFDDYYAHAPRLTCADGFNLSVQAGSGYYCQPREYVGSGDYDAWEIGYPTQADELIIAFADDPKLPLQTIYSFVPTDIVDTLLQRHGGIK